MPFTSLWEYLSPTAPDLMALNKVLHKLVYVYPASYPRFDAIRWNMKVRPLNL